MAYLENQTLRFSRPYKRLNKLQLVALHQAMDVVIKNPKVGEQKTGDLARLLVYKFKIGKEEWLLGYSVNSIKKSLTWHAVGQHENSYRDLKRS